MLPKQSHPMLMSIAMLLLIAGMLLSELAGPLPRIAGTASILVSAVLNGIYIYFSVSNRKPE